MDKKSRYIFGGHAIVAEIRQPNDECGVIGSIALPVTGGCARVENVASRPSQVPGLGVSSFQSASAFVSGRFTKSDKGSSARSQFAAYVNGLDVFGRVKIDALAADLVSETAADADTPKFSFGRTNPLTGKPEQDIIRGLVVDGVSVHVDVDASALNPDYEGIIEEFKPYIAKSIVKLKFEGKPPDRVTIDRDNPNTLVFAGFQLHFGELIVGRSYRNLTLVRLETAAARDLDLWCDVVSGPEGYPP